DHVNHNTIVLQPFFSGHITLQKPRTFPCNISTSIAPIFPSQRLTPRENTMVLLLLIYQVDLY
ncbi:MAG: hypothetical protein PVG62_12780, partial [Desulfobacterales bacterium]